MKLLESVKKQLKALPFFEDVKYEKYRLLLVPFVVLVTAILVMVLITVPQIYKLISTNNTIKELEQKKLFYQKKASELQSIKIQNYRNDLNTALVALPVEKDIPGVMGEILFSLGGSGMALSSITFSTSPAESEKVEEYTITIEASGTETSLRNFLERVTLAPRLIKLTKIQVNNGTNNKLNASIAFVAFYQTLPSNIGKIDDLVPKINQEDTQILADIEAKQTQFPKATAETSQTTTGKLNPFKP
ncbi:type 4a pilus biogenesis protein PilO [Candidatus Daviesbacteria bacterium]|nr:type 4a pilus biogenesis protein PilO [Candidatus Daviesbacteria bacterium]